MTIYIVTEVEDIYLRRIKAFISKAKARDYMKQLYKSEIARCENEHWHISKDSVSITKDSASIADWEYICYGENGNNIEFRVTRVELDEDDYMRRR